jgi:uncharacterized protein YehS (DUF1456 family)
VTRESILEKEEILELFKQLTPEDQNIVIDLLKISLSLSTVDLYKIIEEFEMLRWH